MSVTKSTNRRRSRYVQGGVTELKANKLGFWDKKKLPKDNTDQLYTISSKYSKKPWLLAHDKYGDVQLMWFILQYNTILDIETEFVAGKVISLPTTSRLKIDLLSRSVT